MHYEPMTRRACLSRLALLSAAPLCGCGTARRLARLGGSRPNVVLVLADGQRADDLSAAGHPILRTPNLDRLAREGVRFTQAVIPTPQEAPSRMSFLTGLDAWHHTVMTNVRNTGLPGGRRMFLEQLGENGYETAFVGTWYAEGYGRDRGLDLYYGVEGPGTYRAPAIAEGTGAAQPRTGHLTDLLTARAVAFLKRKRKRPFALAVFYKAPGAPWKGQAAELNLALYRDVGIPPPATLQESLDDKPAAVRAARNRIGDRPLSRPYEAFMRGVYQLIAGVDQGVGALLAALEQTGQAENTVFVFSSAQGMLRGEHGMVGARLMYEPAIRVPLLVRYPAALAGGKTRDGLAQNIDVAPTLLDYAGVAAEDASGTSLRPLLEGGTTGWRQDAFFEYYEYPGPEMVPRYYGVRDAASTFTYYYGEGTAFEMYDLAKDPGETRNLAADPAQAATRRRREQRLSQYLAPRGLYPSQLAR